MRAKLMLPRISSSCLLSFSTDFTDYADCLNIWVICVICGWTDSPHPIAFLTLPVLSELPVANTQTAATMLLIRQPQKESRAGYDARVTARDWRNDIGCTDCHSSHVCISGARNEREEL